MTTSIKGLFFRLLDQDESEYLDFKEKFYEDTKLESLLHDILCMANSRHSGDKYIVFGVSNIGRNQIGISTNYTQDKIVDFLRNAGLNRSLYNDIIFEVFEENTKIYAILTIKERPDKPFFLLSNKNKRFEKLTPGTIYTRNKDTNTPTDRTALDDETELLWRFRFGLDKTPQQRFLDYLRDFNKWKNIDDGYYYLLFPEFRITSKRIDDIISAVPSNDDWIPTIWKSYPRIMRYEYTLTYMNFPLEKVIVWWGDNGREPIPLPEITSDNTSLLPKHPTYEWQLDKNSVRYLVGQMLAIQSNQDYESILNQTKNALLEEDNSSEK
jgi:hypothetical protein